MANELGYFVAGASSVGMGSDNSEVLFGHTYTAVSGDVITAVRVRGQANFASGSATIRVVVIDTANNEVKFAQDVGVTYAGGPKDEEVTVNWPLVAGVTYAIAAVEAVPEALITLSNSATTNSERTVWSASPPIVGSIGTPDGYTGGSVPMVAADVAQVSSPTITNIDTDNAVNQYQQNAVISLSNFTETITSVTLNAVACPIQSQVVGTSVTVDIPGNLATGTYDLVVSGATETATLTGVSYTQTHARPAFDGLVDSNSILSGQSYTPNTYFRFVTSFSNGTLDTAVGDAAEWAGDIADYYTPNSGFTGDDTASIEFLYSDGTTSATVGVTITVSVPPPPASTPGSGRRGFLRPAVRGTVNSIIGSIIS